MTEQLLRPHHMQDENRLAIEAVKDPTRWLYDLAIARTAELRRRAATFRVRLELLDVREYPSDQFGGSGRVFQRDEVGDGVQIVKRWLGPDYLSHRAMRVLASACGMVLPSATAISPRAIPSSTDMRCWSNS